MKDLKIGIINGIVAALIAIFIGFGMFEMNGKEAILLYYLAYITLEISDLKKRLEEKK